MKRRWLRLMSVLMLLAMLISACGSFQMSGEGGLDLGLGGSEGGSGGEVSNQTLLIVFIAVVAVVLVAVIARGR